MKKLSLVAGAIALVFLTSSSLAQTAHGTVKDHQLITAGTGGFQDSLTSFSEFGIGLTSIGDLNGDGVPDAVAGAPFDDRTGFNQGSVWVVFLEPSGSVKHTQLITSGIGGGPTLNDQDNFGKSVTNLGDLDGDGIPDLAVGAEGDDGVAGGGGAVYILFMNRDGTVKSSKKIDGSVAGFQFAIGSFFRFGSSVAGLGDLNLDGIPDLAVGSEGDTTGGFSKGAIHIFHLDTDGSILNHEKIAHNTGGMGEIMKYSNLGEAITGIGDLNGDAIPDLVAGTPGDTTGGFMTGAMHIIYLERVGTVKHHIKVTRKNGFPETILKWSKFGSGVAAIGDLNGDGVTELAVGNRNDSEAASGKGAVWILFMQRGGIIDSVVKISENMNGFPDSIPHFANMGYSVAGIEDYNGDGVSDLLIGVSGPDKDGYLNIGGFYVVSLAGKAQNTGYGNLNKMGDLTLFPNPTSGILTIGASVVKVGVYVLEVRDVLGRTVTREEVKGTVPIMDHSMDLTALRNGVYIVTLSDKKGSYTQARKVFLNR